MKIKNAEIEKMALENRGARERVTALEKHVGILDLKLKLSDEAAAQLSIKLKSIDTKGKKYSDKIKELEENDETKNLLGTRLPDDLKRLLDESIQTN